MSNNENNLTQNDSPAGEFLQSEVWRSFQASVGRKTFRFEGDNFWANIILHTLPVVGEYFYVPRGPILKISNFKFQISNQNQISNVKISKEIQELIGLAKKNNAGWIRIEPANDEILEKIKAWTSNVHNGHLMSRNISIVKAPHDVQPREIFVIDIAKSEEELLAEMKAKTRYNIKLAEKRGVNVFAITKTQDTRYKQNSKSKFQISNQTQSSNDKKSNQYIEEFLRLTVVMAKRQGIVAHPAEYYHKMLENIPGDILKLYVAEYEGKIIAANLVVFYGDTGIYLHGASDDNFRNVMAPYLLQWRQICDAKKAGCVRYDFGGVKTYSMQHETCNKNSWEGITKFKLGFSPQTLPTVFPGSYDIIINSPKYGLYQSIRKIKNACKFLAYIRQNKSNREEKNKEQLTKKIKDLTDFAGIV